MNEPNLDDVQQGIKDMYAAGNAIGLAGAQCTIMLDVLRALYRIEVALNALGTIASEGTLREWKPSGFASTADGEKFEFRSVDR